MKPEKRERGIRLSGHLSLQASRAVEEVQRVYGTRTYDLLSTAMIFYVEAMKRGVGGHALNMGAYKSTPTPERQRAESHTTRNLSAAKAIWCQEAGGNVEGNICNFDKYEVTLAGQTEVMKRSVALQDMPDLKEDFNKMILGGYANVYEARRAVENEAKTK